MPRPVHLLLLADRNRFRERHSASIGEFLSTSPASIRVSANAKFAVGLRGDDGVEDRGFAGIPSAKNEILRRPQVSR